jgi:Ni2+-binding GTPase involved in maturation of urease and hydrogenase
MEKELNIINIDVTGLFGSGKTAIMAIIIKALKKKGIKVKVTETTDYADKKDLLNQFKKSNKKDIIEKISSKSKVVLTETVINKQIRKINGN